MSLAQPIESQLDIVIELHLVPLTQSLSGLLKRFDCQLPLRGLDTAVPKIHEHNRMVAVLLILGDKSLKL